MKLFRTMALIVVMFCVASFGFAQTNQNALTFGVGATGVKSFVGTDIFTNYAVTKNFQLRYDNYMVPGLSMSGNFAGGWYVLPTCKLLANTNLNCNIINVYAKGSVGEWMVNPQNASTQNYFGECGGGGVNYSPADNGTMSVNLFDIQACNTPQGIEPVYSAQFNLGLGVNQRNPDAIERALAREQRKLEKLQRQAAKIDEKNKS